VGAAIEILDRREGVAGGDARVAAGVHQVDRQPDARVAVLRPVGAGAADQGVGTGPADQDVVTFAAIEQIAAAAANDLIVAVITPYLVSGVCASQDIAEAASKQVFDGKERIACGNSRIVGG
jgi:hypothetical protein